MRENQNIAHCSVCSEKTHCRFSLAYIPHRLHSTDSKFHSFLSPNLPNNMGDICKILIQNDCRFITHSPTISIYCLGNLDLGVVSLSCLCCLCNVYIIILPYNICCIFVADLQLQFSLYQELLQFTVQFRLRCPTRNT